MDRRVKVDISSSQTIGQVAAGDAGFAQRHLDALGNTLAVAEFRGVAVGGGPPPLVAADRTCLPRAVRRAGALLAAWAAERAGSSCKDAASLRGATECLDGMAELLVAMRSHCHQVGMDFAAVLVRSGHSYREEVGRTPAEGPALEDVIQELAGRMEKAYTDAFPDHPGLEWEGYGEALEVLGSMLGKVAQHAVPLAAPVGGFEEGLQAWYATFSVHELDKLCSPGDMVVAITDLRHYCDASGIDFGKAVAISGAWWADATKCDASLGILTTSVAERLSAVIEEAYDKAGDRHPGVQWVGYCNALVELCTFLPDPLDGSAAVVSHPNWGEATKAVRDWAERDHPVLWGSGGPVPFHAEQRPG